jgi:hypothetical protein
VSEKHIEKLEAALKKCSKMIKKYEEKEVDWDNEAEEESNYLMTNRLKKRFMKIYAKIAEAKALSASLDRRSDKRLKCAESRYLFSCYNNLTEFMQLQSSGIRRSTKRLKNLSTVPSSSQISR